MKRLLLSTILLIALAPCEPVTTLLSTPAAVHVEQAPFTAQAQGFDFGDVSTVATAGADSNPYAALFAAIDASSPTLEYNALREWVAGNYADGDPVTSATEWVSGTYQATQGTAANQPTFIESANGGHPAFRFDGGDWLQATGFSYSQPNTVLVVGNVNALLTSMQFTDGSASSTRHQIAQYASGLWGIYAGSSISGGTPNTSTHVFVATFNGASSSLYIDNTLVVSSDAGAQSFGGLVIGARYSLDSGFLDGDTQLGPIIWDGLADTNKITAILTELESLGLVTIP